MQIFKDYISLLVEFKIEKNKLTAILGDDTKLRHFYEGIAHKTMTTEDEAAAVIYGQGVTASDANFRRLKTDLKKKVQQLLLMVDFSQHKAFNDYQKAGYSIFKNLAVFKILRGRVKRSAAADIAKHIFEEASLHGFSDAILWSAEFMKTHHGRVDIDEKKKVFYTAAYSNALDAFYAEKKAEFFVDDFSRHFEKTKATKKWLEPQVVEHCGILDSFGSIDTPNFIIHSGLMHIYRYLVINDYKSALPECNKYIAQLEARPTLHKVGLATLLQQKIVCCMMLKQFDEAVAIGLRSRELAITGQHNWYNNCILLMQLYIRREELDTAWVVYQEALGHENFKSQTEATQETVSLYGAYLNWFIGVQSFSVPKEDYEAAQNFKVQRFMNDLSVLSSDKSGMNIPVLLLQILHLFSTNKYDAISERLEAIRKYQSRYAGEHTDTRLKALVRLLEIADSDAYNYKTLNKDPKIAELHAFLIGTVADIENMNHQTEVIAYEHYWTYADRFMRGKHPVFKNRAFKPLVGSFLS